MTSNDRKKRTIFLSHNVTDKAFVRLLALHLTQAGAGVWLDDAEIKVGESLIGKIESGLVNSDYLGVVLSPDSVSSNWVQTELRAVLIQEITSGGPVKVLPIYYRDCEMPLFLRDKLYVDFRKGSYRKALMKLLNAMGLNYEPIKRLQKDIAYDPFSEATERIGNISDEHKRRVFATALQVSAAAPFIVNSPTIPIPKFIEENFGIPISKQCSYRISLSRRDAYRYLRDMGRVLHSFLDRGVEERYRQKFGRYPATGDSGPKHFVFSYCELFEWFDIPEELTLPEKLCSLVMQELMPAFADKRPT
jgi:hypothetical protein